MSGTCKCVVVNFYTIISVTFLARGSKTSKIAASKPFFPKFSLVTDYPDGRLSVAQSEVALSDLSFVLFYAPWCAESQYARASYEYVAGIFDQEAHFSAINCWQPGGECRAQYTKVTFVTLNRKT